jgi:hypothetical protein
MKFEQSANRMIKLFNQSIEGMRLSKIKSLLFAFLLVGASVTLLSAPVQAAESSTHDRDGQLGKTFSILLSGPYKPVVHNPDLGLTTVDLTDGSFSKTKIFRISGLPEEDRGPGDRDREALSWAKRFHESGRSEGRYQATYTRVFDHLYQSRIA